MIEMPVEGQAQIEMLQEREAIPAGMQPGEEQVQAMPMVTVPAETVREHLYMHRIVVM